MEWREVAYDALALKKMMSPNWNEARVERVEGVGIVKNG